MTWWIGYARRGREFEVRDAIQDLGVRRAWVAQKIAEKRVPTKRLPVLVTSPALSNFVFIDCTDDQWHQLRDVKHLAPTLTMVPGRAARASPGKTTEKKDDKWVNEPGVNIISFMKEADETYEYEAALLAQRIVAGERVEGFVSGDRIRILAGPLMGQLATFRRLVDATGFDNEVRLVADVGTLGGKPLEMRLDPLHVRAAE